MLKERHRRERAPPNLSLRIHRALSWLNRAEQADNSDSRPIFLWIAFNAAYTTDIDEQRRLSEQETFKSFLEKLCSLDTSHSIEKLVWTRVLWQHTCAAGQPIRIPELLGPPEHLNGKSASPAASVQPLQHSPAVLGVLFNRIYTLRNQLVHGGATWNGSVNRNQLRDCCNLLGKLVPLIILLMLDNPDTLWGEACYPVVS